MKGIINSTRIGLLLIPFVVLSSGCGNSGSKPSTDEKYASFLSEMGVMQLPVLIVPTRGCGPCIKSAMDFLRDSLTSSTVSVVISGPTEKSCSLLLKKFNVHHDDAIFDIGARANKLGIITIYPLMISSKGKGLQASEITPDNYDALRLD